MNARAEETKVSSEEGRLRWKGKGGVEEGEERGNGRKVKGRTGSHEGKEG
jgi:hypothetical protein